MMETNNYNIKVLLCGIAKLENHYIREWVEHYKDLGFDNICLYDNNDKDGEHFEDVIGDYIENGFVLIQDVRGLKSQQIPCYNKCYKELGNSYDWIAFFDIDEFLILNEKYENNIKKFIMDDKFSQFNCIRVSWQNYDDNDLIKVENGNYNCKERFTRPKKGDHQSKSIVKTKLNGLFSGDNPHVLYSKLIKPCKANGIPCKNFNGQFLSNNELEFAKLNHYRFKTIEEYVLGKMVRLWPTNYKGGGKTALNLSWFFRVNKRTKEKEEYAASLIAKKNNNKSKTTMTKGFSF